MTEHTTPYGAEPEAAAGYTAGGPGASLRLFCLAYALELYDFVRTEPRLLKIKMNYSASQETRVWLLHSVYITNSCPSTDIVRCSRSAARVA